MALLLFAISACEKTPEETIIPVASVSLNQTEAEMLVGETLQLQAQISPSNATDLSTMWGSSKQSVATVSDAGLVTAVGEGTSKITVTAGGKSATCTITVTKPEVPVVHVESVTLDKTDAQLEIGGTLTLTATVLPENADDKSVTWKSTNPQIAEVDQNGTVTAISSGTVTITATTTDGGKVAGCEVTVSEVYVPVESVEFLAASVIMDKGESFELELVVLPENASNKTVTWTSSNPDVVTVDQQGRITGVGAGKAVITAEAGDKTATCPVTVTVAAQSIALNQTDIEMNVGESTTLTATLLPEDCTSDIFWYSSDSNVVSVENGVLTAHATGQATIHAAVDGVPDAVCTVTVTDSSNIPVDYLGLNYSHLYLTTGDVRSLSVKVFPENATNRTVTWTSSDSNIVTVTESGSVTAVGAGEASIVATVDGKSVSLDVTVKSNTVPVESITVDQPELLLKVGEETVLSATVGPSSAASQVAWSISDPEIATIDPATGHLTVLKKGWAVITATAGEKTSTATLSVINPVQRIDLSRTTMELTRGEQVPLSAVIYPADADNPTLTWVSSDSSIASVDRYEGTVWARSVGSATITCINESAAVVATCTVTVLSPGNPYISLEQDNFTVDASASEDIKIPYKIVNPDGSSSFTVSVSDGSDWLKIRQSGSLYFYVYGNSGTSSRTGTITLTYGSNTVTVTITQSGKTPAGPSDIVFSTGFDPNANNAINAAGDNTCTILASVVNPVDGVELQMSADVPWMTNFRTGSTPDVYYFAASKNTTGRMRTGHVTMTYGNVSKVIKFVQMADDVTIILNPSDMTFNYEAHTVSFDVTLPDDFDYTGLNATLDGNYSWITNLAVNGRTVTFDLKENNDTGATERTARIKVSLGEQTSYFNVTQTLDAPTVNVVDKYSVGYLGQKVYMVAQITNPRSDVQLSTHVVGGNLDWIYSNPGGTVTVKENSTGQTRSAQVEVSYGNFAKKTVTVTQTSSRTEIKPSVSTLTFPSKAEQWTFTVEVTDPLQDIWLQYSIADSWASVEFVRQLSPTSLELMVKVRKNYWPVERSSSLVFRYGDFTHVVPIVQAAGDEVPLGFVDLGLPSGTLWAQTNLGAAKEYNFGYYYAWGETSPKSKYTWFNYKLATGKTPWDNITKYNDSDGKTVLEAADDAATATNAAWSIPTDAQWQELIDNCDIRWVMTPVEGVRCTSKVNEESIFLPAAGWKSDDDALEALCWYWSKNRIGGSGAYQFEATELYAITTGCTRYYGLPIRPVRQR